MATGNYVYVLTDDTDQDNRRILGAWIRRYEAVGWIRKNVASEDLSWWTVTTVRFGSSVVGEESAYDLLARAGA